MFKIGTFSKLSNITVKMLRHYDEIGLLKPNQVDTTNDYRYYCAEQLRIASQINNYKSLGFSLKSIKILLEDEDDMTSVLTHLKLRKIEIEEEQSMLNQQLEKIQAMSEKEPRMQQIKYNVVQKSVPTRNVISLRKIISNYSEEATLWSEIYQYIQKNNIKPIYDGYTMTIYHDKEFKDKNIDTEIQITIENKKETNFGNISFFETNPFEVLSVTFAGSYEQMPKVTETIAQYIEQKQLDITNEMINIFHVSHAQTPNENEWVTEACYILEKGA